MIDIVYFVHNSTYLFIVLLVHERVLFYVAENAKNATKPEILK